MMVKSFELQWPYFVVSVLLALKFGICDNVHSNTVAVSRRKLKDLYYSASCHCSTLCHDNTTYLVTEQQCISNSNFFNECSLAITPTGESHQLRLTVNSVNRTSRLQTFSSTRASTNAIIVRKSTNEEVNNSFCHISSLEAYRGREQAFMISHEGLSLGNSGTIEVNESQLAYNSTEYDGELYRMNISCNSSDSEKSTDSTLPINSCLFFKVFGTTAITDAKFNCTVPGTISTECTQITPIHQISTEATTSQSLSPMITPLTATEEPHTSIIGMSNNNRPVLETGSPLFYGLVAVGSAIIFILLLCVIGVLILACRRQCKNDVSHNEKQVGQPTYEDLDIRNGRTAIANPGYNNNLANANTMNGSGDVTRAAEHDFTSHTYQEIGATYQEIMPVAKDPNRPPQWGMTNPSLFLDQLNLEEEEETREYSTLNHTRGQKALNHCNESTIMDSEQYAKLDVAG